MTAQKLSNKGKNYPRSKTVFSLCSTVAKKQNNVTNNIFSHQTKLGPQPMCPFMRTFLIHKKYSNVSFRNERHVLLYKLFALLLTPSDGWVNKFRKVIHFKQNVQKYSKCFDIFLIRPPLSRSRH